MSALYRGWLKKPGRLLVDPHRQATHRVSARGGKPDMVCKNQAESFDVVSKSLGRAEFQSVECDKVAKIWEGCATERFVVLVWVGPKRDTFVKFEVQRLCCVFDLIGEVCNCRQKTKGILRQGNPPQTDPTESPGPSGR